MVHKHLTWRWVATLGFPADASFPRPIFLASQLLVHLLAPLHRGQGEDREADDLGLVINKGTYEACLGQLPDE